MSVAPAKIAWLWGVIAIALVIGPSRSSAAIATALVLTFVTVCLGHSVGLHRGIIHETYERPRWLQNVLLYFFVHTGLGGPLSWILLHHTRDHWQNERDTPPYFAYRHSLAKDFWWNLHCGFEPRDASIYGVPREQTSDPWLRFLERTWFAHPLALFALFALAFGAPFAATVVLCRVAITVLGHWFVGFVSHKYGEVRWDLDGSSEVGRNNLLLGWLSFGEGFHNNHHAHPGSARMGFRCYELDIGWLAVRAMGALGLIRDVRAYGRSAGTARGNASERSVSDPSRWNESTWGIRTFESPALLASAGEFVRSRFVEAGFGVESQTYEIDGQSHANYVVEIAGASRSAEIVVVGAHYDSFLGAGADDNASGTAMLLALARRFHGATPERTLRFVAFTNEEPPHFWTENMGSLVYARGCKARGDDVVAMLSLESLGVFSNERGSQHYPRPFSLLYPDTGNFVGFVGNVSSRDLTRRVVGTFRAHARIPSEGAALPAARVIAGKPVGLQGIDWSDHWSFWQVGYPALMVTDTAVFRNVNYHSGADTPEKLDYERMVLVEQGLAAVVSELAGIRESR